MKKTKLTFWITTYLFSAFMLFSSIPNILMDDQSIAFLGDYLGYPEYFIPFIGVAKVLGSITILIPKLKTIKEWAYAGLTFDLLGAFYSNLMVNGFDPGLLFMLVLIGFLGLSYYSNWKLNQTKWA